MCRAPRRAARTPSCRGARAMSAALLTCKGVTCRFGGLVALARVDFEVNDGEIVGLIGPNGSGKTTLFNVVTGIYGADEGAVTFARQGHDRRDATSDLSRGRDPHLPALAHVPAAVGVRQYHGRQPQAAEPRPRLQPAAARRVCRRARAQPRGGARAGEGVQRRACRPHRGTGGRPADDRSTADRDLPCADQPAAPRPARRAIGRHDARGNTPPDGRHPLWCADACRA